jgi:hypothetical protein
VSVAQRTARSLAYPPAAAETGSYKRHLGLAEETLADYVADRCELSGNVGCGDE